MKDFMAVSMIWFFTVAWWGAVCPEFAWTRECITRINEENGAYEELMDENGFIKSEELFALLDNSENQIEVKSRLLEWLEQWQ